MERRGGALTVVLAAGGDRAVLDPAVGGKLTSLVAGGDERILGAEEAGTDEVLLWGSFLMAPWAGRLREGVLPWDGEVHRFEQNFGGHAIHGLAFDAAWSVRGSSDPSVEMALDLAQVGWPFGGTLAHRATLAAGSLELVVDVEADERAMPVAVGWHPYFRRPATGDLAVEVGSDHVLETTPDLIPTGELVAVEGATDLRGRPSMGDRRLDHVYADVRAPAVVEWPDLELELDFEPPVATVVVYSPPHAACVEPQTAWPDAPALASRDVAGTGLHRLEPGYTFSAHTTWR